MLPHVPAPAVEGFIAGFTVHLIWDVVAGTLLVVFGFKMGTARACHHGHRSQCCENPLHQDQGGPK
jgi:hypothetical protein